MRVLIQWATATVSDWVEYDITRLSQVRAMPKKPVPSDSPLIDDNVGWISAINIQGVVFQSWDHIGFGISGGVLQVGAWNDDAADFPAVPWGVLYTFDTPAPDPNFGGAINTRQTVTRYADISTLQALLGTDWDNMARLWLADPSRRAWSEFPRFNNKVTIHGVWSSPEHNDALVAARSPRGWREWIGG